MIERALCSEKGKEGICKNMNRLDEVILFQLRHDEVSVRAYPATTWEAALRAECMASIGQ